MKAVDPSIKIIMGNYWIYHKNFKETLEIAGPQIDLVNNRGGAMKEIQDDAATLKDYNAAHGRDITLCDSEYNARDWDPIGKCAQNSNGAKPALEGAALQPIREKNDPRSYFDKKCRWDYAMGVMSDYMDFHNLGGSIQFINFFCTMDFWGSSLVECGKDHVFPSTAGQALAFLKDQPIAWPVAISNTNADLSFKSSAAWNSDKTELTVLILNYDGKDKDFSVDLSALKRTFQPAVSIDRIGAPSPDTYNSENAPSQIVRETITAQLDGVHLRHTCKPYSATAIRLKAFKQ
jgi:alpha-N-arabinofuranosidase